MDTVSHLQHDFVACTQKVALVAPKRKKNSSFAIAKDKDLEKKKGNERVKLTIDETSELG